jgi:hypothetical protein
MPWRTGRWPMYASTAHGMLQVQWDFGNEDLIDTLKAFVADESLERT